MVELASKKFVCIVDESKLVSGLGGSKGESQQAYRLMHMRQHVRLLRYMANAVGRCWQPTPALLMHQLRLHGCTLTAHAHLLPGVGQQCGYARKPRSGLRPAQQAEEQEGSLIMRVRL